MVDRGRRRRPARSARRTLRLRAHDRAADAADRAPSSHCRRRRMRAHRRAAAGLQPHSGLAQALWRRRPALRPASRGRRAAATRGSATFPRSRSRAKRRARPARPISASARCICCSRATEAGRAPTIPRIAASSIRSSSTCWTIRACRATRRSTPRSRRWRRSSPPLRRPTHVEYEEVWLAKRAALEAWSAAFARLRAARPSDPLIADYHAFARSGGETLRRFAAFQAAADGEAGPELGSLAAGSARRRPKGDRPCDRTQPPRL